MPQSYILAGSRFPSIFFTMSAPSSTASQTEFCDAMSKVHVYSEPLSGCDTPVPISKISADTLDTLNAVSSKLEATTSNSMSTHQKSRQSQM